MYNCTVCNELIDKDEIVQHMTLTHHVTVYNILNLLLNQNAELRENINFIKERLEHLEKAYYKGF